MRAGYLCLVLVSLAAGSVYGQMQDNHDKQMSCDHNRGNSDQARHCEIREQSFAGPGRLTVDGGVNGGASVKGWLRSDVLVRAQIEAWADDDAQASLLAGQVHVDMAGGQIRASGPESARHSGWSVSYEIFVPQTTDLNLKTHNGGISISDVRGRIEFDAVNGGVHLRRVAGDISGATVNGGLNVELVGNSWEGRQLEARTSNGGVTISMPEFYSAHIQTETVNGGIQSDFPITLHGNLRPRNLDFNVGSGGPLIHVTTTNGGVKLKKS
jgi:hypothetical protein